MKIKQTILIFALLFIGAGGLLLNYPVSAAQCGGVETSIINCDQKGLCADGTHPYEGSKPSNDTEVAAYFKKYFHNYGECKDGSAINNNLDQNGVWGILLLIINILTACVGVAAVGGIIYGSILYTSSGGNSDNTKKARTIIFNVAIGLVVYALMFAFLQYIIPGGVFQ
jgi:hypothetical protein